MRKLKYYVASSVDGFIAHEDGTWHGFLPEGEHDNGVVVLRYRVMR